MNWRFDVASTIGGRPEQQDRAEVFALPLHNGDRLVVLADGMGGQRDGGLAAQAVIDTARAAVTDSPIDHPHQFLGELCRRADRDIVAIGRQRETNPASTCVLLYLSDAEAYWAHVGDSRLYHFQADTLLSHTRDHTIGELLKEAGQAPVASRRVDHRLYMCLGGQNELNPEFGATAIGADDWFVLCSDGFWGQLDIDEVVARRHSARGDDDLATELVGLARERGGAHSDNVSLVLATQPTSRLRQAWQRLRRVGG